MNHPAEARSSLARSLLADPAPHTKTVVVAGHAIAKLRAKLRIKGKPASQTAFCDDSGFSESTLKKIEAKASYRVRLATVLSLAEALTNAGACTSTQLALEEFLVVSAAPSDDARIRIRTRLFCPLEPNVQGEILFVNDRQESPAAQNATTRQAITRMTRMDYDITIATIDHEGVYNDLVSYAQWRKDTYERLLEPSDGFAAEFNLNVKPLYCLSVADLLTSPWVGDELVAALRLLSSPRCILEGDCSDPTCREREMIALHSTEPPDFISFGVPGDASGCASWSGVALSLPPSSHSMLDDVWAFETRLQWIWTICDLAIRTGWQRIPLPTASQLRIMGLDLKSIGSREARFVRSAKHAILRTSQIDQMIQNALDLESLWIRPI